MVSYIIMTLLGAALIIFGIKKSKLILIGGALLAAVGLFLVICTIILAYSVSHSEPNPRFDINSEYNEVSENTDEDGKKNGVNTENDNPDNDAESNYTDNNAYSGETGGIEGADWRSWRSYSEDYVISTDVTVCLSGFSDGSGFAVYDSRTGDRVGSLVIKNTAGDTENAGSNAEIKCEDTDGDGIKELGIVLSSDRTVWFRYTGDVWTEGSSGGCFSQIDIK